MLKNYFSHLFAGVCIAQLAVPLAVGLFWVYRELTPHYGLREFDFAAFMMFTFGGFAITVPVSVFIGLPSLILLYKSGMLSFISIFMVSLFIGLIPTVLDGDIRTLGFSFPIAICGGLICCLYLSWTGTLTSQEKNACGSDAQKALARS